MYKCLILILQWSRKCLRKKSQGLEIFINNNNTGSSRSSSSKNTMVEIDLNVKISIRLLPNSLSRIRELSHHRKPYRFSKYVVTSQQTHPYILVYILFKLVLPCTDNSMSSGRILNSPCKLYVLLLINLIFKVRLNKNRVPFIFYITPYKINENIRELH